MPGTGQQWIAGPQWIFLEWLLYTCNALYSVIAPLYPSSVLLWFLGRWLAFPSALAFCWFGSTHGGTNRMGEWESISGISPLLLPCHTVIGSDSILLPMARPPTGYIWASTQAHSPHSFEDQISFSPCSSVLEAVTVFFCCWHLGASPSLAGSFSPAHARFLLRNTTTTQAM